MVDESAGTRRLAVLERPAPIIDQTAAGPPLEPEGSLGSGQLLELLGAVADSVRAGRYATSDRDGVLVDTVVGNTRCLLLVHEPTLMVRLSPREQEIARMVANGRTNSAIAGALDISVWTVSTHLRRIFAKLAVGSRAEMVAHLLGQREIPPVGQYDWDR